MTLRSLLTALAFVGTAAAQSPPTAIEVYPPDINLETSRDRQSFVVQAWFADGLSRDVTALEGGGWRENVRWLRAAAAARLAQLPPAK